MCGRREAPKLVKAAFRFWLKDADAGAHAGTLVLGTMGIGELATVQSLLS